MKIYKRAAMVLAGTMFMMNAIPASANELDKVMRQPAVSAALVLKDSRATTENTLNISKESDSDKDYQYIRVTSRYPENIDTNTFKVYLDSKEQSIKVEKNGNNEWRFKATQSGKYSISAIDRGRDERISSNDLNVTVDGKPTVSLTKKTSGGKTYISIKIVTSASLDEVTINGDKYTDFRRTTGEQTKEYEVTESGKYTVTVTDKKGRETSDYINITLDDAPEVKLDKKQISGKWYLIANIKPQKGTKISKVKINNETVSCDRSGEEIQYEVKKTGTYKVVVTANNDLQTTKELTIDIKDEKTAPKLSVTTSTINNIALLKINISSSAKISKLTVNGTSIDVPSTGGIVQYPVTATGNYSVVVTDENGNQSKQDVYVQAGTTSNTNTNTNTNTNNNTTSGKHTVTFTLNQKSWTLDGVTKSMDVATTSRNNRIYIPLRYVANALGVSSEAIQWNTVTKTVTITDGSNVVRVPLGKNTITANGQTITMDAAAIQVNGRVMIPISQVAKAFSYKNINMDWQSAKKQVVITRS